MVKKCILEIRIITKLVQIVAYVDYLDDKNDALKKLGRKLKDDNEERQ